MLLSLLARCCVQYACVCVLQVCPWYDGPTLFETLDTVEVQTR
jgi:translation elongation factor EF-1alpha